MMSLIENNQTKNTTKTNYAKLAALSCEIKNRIEEILTYFGIEYRFGGNKYTMCCPVHGGDNKHGCNLYIDYEVMPWRCNTNNCQLKYGKGIYGFLRGILSRISGAEVPMSEAIGWAEKFLSFNSDIPYDDTLLEKIQFNKQNKILSDNRIIKNTGITRELIREHLVMPVNFYMEKGFSEKLLDFFDVGYCNNPNKQMYQRIVVPVYDDDYKYMVGCVGRTLKPKCKKCKLFHIGSCPQTSFDIYKGSKWINSKDFNTQDFFYNYWFAKNEIIKTNTAILVEGQADVWRIFDAGYKNVLGMFGLEITEHRRILLEKSAAINIIIFTDPDTPGENALKKINEQLGYMYNIYPVKSNVQPSELNNKQVKDIIEPILKRCSI